MVAALLAWLVLVPMLTAFPALFGLPWYLYIGLVAAMALLAVPRLLRGGAAVAGGAGAVRPAPLRAGFVPITIALALLSLLVSVLAARPGAPRFDLVLGMLMGLAHAAFFLLCLGWLPDAEADAATVRRTCLWLASALGLMILGQFAMVLVEGQLTDPLHRPDGTMGNPNVLGTLVGAAMLALIGLLRLRGWRLLALLPLLPLLVLTRSRGALLATGLTVLLLAVHWRLRALLVAVALLAALLVIVPNPLRDRVASLQAEHDFSRLFLWESALQRSTEVPLGIGPGMNRYDFPSRALDPEHPWLLHQRRAIGLTHNVFLTLWLEWGWLAGAALLALTVGVAARVLHRRLLDDDPLALGAALGSCVIFLELQVDGIEQNPTAFSVFLLLLAAALARVSRRSAARGIPVPRKLAAAGALVLALLLFTALGWRALDARRLHEAQGLVADFEVAAAAGPVAPGRGAGTPAAPSVATVRQALALAESVRPLDADNALATFLFERNRVRRLMEQPAAAGEAATRAAGIAEGTAAAFAALDRARTADGYDPELPELGAQFALQRYYKLGRQAEDLATYVHLMKAALALDPLNVDGHWDLAQEAQRTHQPALAEEQLALLFALEPDHAYAWYVLGRLAQAEGDGERSLYCFVRAAEAVLNCQLKVLAGNPASQAFYQRNLDRVDLADVWKRVWDLRRELYF